MEERCIRRHMSETAYGRVGGWWGVMGGGGRTVKVSHFGSVLQSRRETVSGVSDHPRRSSFAVFTSAGPCG